MSSKFTSPYATSFKNGVKRGTPWFTVVENIAKRYKKTPNFVWESLYKAGFCYRIKFNGQWMYWPKDAPKTNNSYWKQDQFYMWQWFVNYAVSAGYCTPEQLKKYATNQKHFMTYCRKFFGKQYHWNKTTAKSHRRKVTRNYKFPAARKRTTRRYRKAA